MKGVTFGNFHSWYDFSLILSGKTIGAATPKVETISIPGADGVLDITEYFGDVNYNNRKLSFVFSTIVPQSQFLNLFSEIQNAVHGKKVRIILDDDPNFYYVGRVTVSDWKANRNIGELTIDCDCEPYKYKLNQTTVTTQVSGSATIVLNNLREKVVPTITTDAAITLEFNDKTYNFTAGTWINPDINLIEGENEFDVTGTATITFVYQEGGL